MVFELNGLGSDGSSTSCGFKNMTRDFPFPNYTLLLEQVDKVAPSYLAHHLVRTQAQDGLAPALPLPCACPDRNRTEREWRESAKPQACLSWL